MKIRRINTTFLLLALAGMTLTGCSNEDIANVTPQEEGTGNVSFSIVEKDYEPADNTPKSRAAIEETKPEIQDLGDGLIAKVSLVPDTTHRIENPKTRAIATPTHYTIQAFQGGVKKGELKGTFNGSTFTPDTGQPKSISLPHGTYDFVCFNDKVTANGTQFTVNRSDAATARFTVQRNVINQDPKQQVTFKMKHAGARVNTQAWFLNFHRTVKVTNVQAVDEWGENVYKCEYVNPDEQFKGTLETPVGAIPEKMVYDISTTTSSYLMGQLSRPFEADAGSMPVAYSTPGGLVGGTAASVGTDYLLPSTDCSKLKLTFTHGEIAGSSLVGKSITVPDTKIVEANKAYTLVIRLYITNQYLYSDGTFGPRNKNQGKTPIGVVIRVKDIADPMNAGIAIALHDVKKGGSDQIQWNNSVSSETSSPVTNYNKLFTNNYAGMVDYSTGAATQSARDYTPRPGTSVWNIANISTFLYMAKGLGKMIEYADFKQVFETYPTNGFLVPSGASATGFTTPAPSTVNFPAMDMTHFNNAFTNVGGTPPSGTYWTSTECKDGTEYKMATITISGGKYHLDLKPKTSTAKVRPVIEF